MFTFNGETIQGQRVGQDSIFVKDFARIYLKQDADELFEYLRDDLPWINRNQSFMKYRGKPIARTKSFLTARRGVIHKYGYTGFQWKSMRNYACYKDYPRVKKIVADLNAKLALPGVTGFNHVIATMYEDSKDAIGYHSDKTHSWTLGSSVAILSLGGTRDFCMQGENIQVFKCEAGDMFILGWKDNQTHKHCIPVSKIKVNPRISLCFRNIKECFTLEEIEKKIAASERASERRKTKS